MKSLRRGVQHLNYTFRIYAYQDKLGSENALLTVKFDDAEVLSEVEVVSTNAASPDMFEFRVERQMPHMAKFGFKLLNDEFIDVNSDRNIVLTGIELREEEYYAADDIDGADRPFESFSWKVVYYGDIEERRSIEGWEDIILTHSTDELVIPIVIPHDAENLLNNARGLLKITKPKFRRSADGSEVEQ